MPGWGHMSRWVSPLLLLGVLLAVVLAAPPSDAQDLDPVLNALRTDAVSRDPALLALRHRISAESVRGGPAGALPDPSLNLGYQNDGFTSLPLGSMPTTYVLIQAAQSLPYPGKRAARSAAAVAGVGPLQAQLTRQERTLEAQLDREWVTLLAADAQLRVLDAQEALWKSAVQFAQSRIQTGQGLATDLMRAKLAVSRLGQTRVRQVWAGHAATLALNRIAQRPLDAPIQHVQTLEQLGMAEAPTSLEMLVQTAQSRSPELAANEAELRGLNRRQALAHLEAKPDFTVMAGLMPRGGMEPMWMVQLGMTLPFLNPDRTSGTVEEVQWRRQALHAANDGVTRQLRTRMTELRERMLVQVALLRTHRTSILPQSESAVDAALRDYAAGRTPFSAVLDAGNALAVDRQTEIQLLEEFHLLRIALEQADLEAIPERRTAVPSGEPAPAATAAMPAGGM